MPETAERCPTVAEGSALYTNRRTWEYGVAPHYIGLFLWVVFAERIGRTTLPVGGLGFSLIGLLIGGLLCRELLFRRTARWGRSADKTTMELAGRVFGKVGAKLVGVVIGLAEVVWFAVAVSYATEYTLHGLVRLDFLPESVLRPFEFGSTSLPSKLFLVTSLFWCFAAALTATWLIRVIAAIMNAYPLFPALALGAAMLILLKDTTAFAPTGIDPVGGRFVPETQGSLLAITRSIQLVLGFFALSGVLSADWGKGSATDRDVNIGGWVGVAFPPVVVGTVALMLLAGYQGKVFPNRAGDDSGFEPPRTTNSNVSTITETAPAGPPSLVVKDAIDKGIGGRLAGAMLLILGLGSLAPAVYASFSSAHRFKEAIGGISRIAWMLVATAASWPLVATGWARNLETVFALSGAVFASMAGAYAAIASKDRYAWTGDRRGINPSTLVGWIVGTAVGLLPFLPVGAISRLEPAALWGFVAAFGLTRILAGAGWEPTRPAEQVAGGSEVTSPL